MASEAPDAQMAKSRFKLFLKRIGSILLLAQPYLTFLVFLSVLAGTPPLWISWMVALLPSTFRLYLKQRPFPRTPFDTSIVILTAAMLSGFFLSSSKELAYSALNTYFAGLVFYYSLVGNGQAKRGYWLTFATFLLIVFLFLSVIVFSGSEGKQVSFNIWIYALASNLHFFNEMGMHSNVLGAIFAIVSPVLLAIAISPQKTIVRLMSGTAAIICWGLLLLSASGGAWIAAVIGVFVVLLTRGRKVLLGMLITFSVIFGTTTSLWYRTAWMDSVLPYQNLLARMDFWRATVVALQDHPIMGLGLGAWWSVVNTSISPGGPHSTYLQLYSDCGILGLIALAAAIIPGIKLCLRIFRSSKIDPGYGISVGLVAGCITAGTLACIDNIFVVLTPVRTKDLCFTVPLIWILLALLLIASQRIPKDSLLTA